MRRSLLRAFAPHALSLVAGAGYPLLPDGGDGGQGGGGGTGNPPGGDPPKPPGGDPPKPAGGDPPKPGQVKQFSQADVDKIVQSRVADEKQRHDKALEDEKAKLGKTEQEKLQMERDAAVKERDEARTMSVATAARAEAKVQALIAKAKPERVDAVVRNADLSDVATDGQADEAKVKEAVEKVLADYPEWKQGTTSPRSGGELNGGDGGKEPTLEDFRKMNELQRSELYRSNEVLYNRLADAEYKALGGPALTPRG
ncbi:MAG: hypothetical protein ACRD0W_19705 [Acidimicrobiales bacterium]